MLCLKLEDVYVVFRVRESFMLCSELEEVFRYVYSSFNVQSKIKYYVVELEKVLCCGVRESFMLCLELEKV